MAQFFKAKPNSSKQLSAKLSLEISQLDHLGQGIAQHDGKVVFVPGVLPTERATVQLVEQKKNYAKAKLIKIDSVSSERVAPLCSHYGRCGGCDLQHLSLSAQREFKQVALAELMAKLGDAKSTITELHSLEPSIVGEGWHYRRRARLATHFDKGTKKLTLGFRAASSNDVVAINACPVMANELSMLIAPLSMVLNHLTAKASLGHVELINADNGQYVVLRVTKNLSEKDCARLAEFAIQHKLTLLLQDNEGQFITLSGHSAFPYYQLGEDPQLGESPVKLAFSPGNFVQVNGEINQAMVAKAIDWLDVQPNERVLDLFCGMGNFSLPLAQKRCEVIGVEGVVDMVQQARDNASANGLQGMTFYHGDLSADLSKEKWMGRIDKLLLDPARAGAYESLQWLKKMKPKRVVYVSCNPASLARDSSVLLEQGYQLQKLTMIDMFPQTHHIEAMALFELIKPV